MKKILITDPVGLHARPASVVVREAAKFTSDITFVKGDKSANAKSIMKVMSLGVQQNDTLIIEAVGDDAESAETTLAEKMVEQKLGNLVE